MCEDEIPDLQKLRTKPIKNNVSQSQGSVASVLTKNLQLWAKSEQFSDNIHGSDS